MDTADIQKRMDALGLKQRDLAEAIGLEADKVSKIFSGIRQWKVTELAKAAEWLDGAEAVKARAASQPLDIARAPDQLPTRGAYDDVGSIKLRRVNMSFAMGDGTNMDDFFEEGHVEFDANWLRTVTASPPELLVMADGIGDSMQPTIMDHDQVLIDRSQTRMDKGDRIWALTISGSGAVKRLFPAGNGMVEVMSDNPMHPNKVRLVPLEEIRIIGRVVWSGRRH